MAVHPVLRAAASRVTLTPFLAGVIAFAVANSVRLGVSPNEKVFFLDDRSIGLPRREETVPYNAVLVSLVPAWLLTVALEAWAERLVHRSAEVLVQTAAQSALLLLSGFNMQFAAVEITKVTLGQHRPDFLARCQPDAALLPGTPASEAANWPCTGANEDVIEAGRKSFPSGHTASTWFIAAYVGFYALQLLFRRDWRRWGGARAAFPYADPAARPRLAREAFGLAATLFVFGCFAPAFYVGSSRVLDHRHHAWDVGAGAVIGLFTAAVTVLLGEGYAEAAAAAALKRGDAEEHDDEDRMELVRPPQ